MTRCLACLLLTVGLLASVLPAQEEAQHGIIKKVNADKGILTITVKDADRDFVVTDDTKLFDAGFKDIEQRLKDPRFKVGAKVMFKAHNQNNQDVLLGLKLDGPGQPGPGGGPGGGIQRGTLKKLDLDKMSITLTVDGKDHTYGLTEETKVLDAPGQTLKEKLQGFKVGAEVFFKPQKQDGKEVLFGIKLAGGPAAQPKVDTSHLKPLTEMGMAKYQDVPGGLYPNGKNERPQAHETAGLALAKQVQPLAKNGQPSKNGKIVLLSVGMSNTSQASQGFEKALAGFNAKNPQVQFVNGAVGGMTAWAIQDPEDGKSGTKYWTEVDNRLQMAGVSRAQVQVIWIKEADAGPSQGFPGYAKKLEGELANIVQTLPARFPNLKLVYLSSRTYGGYATTKLNPEPYAYESGFAVKWLIEKQISGDPALNYDPKKGAVKAPWLSWGPYLWANGSTKRADGFSYEQGDFTPSDGTHLTASGVEKVGNLMLQFFKNDSTTRPWFVTSSGE
jgi:hypothetical protein